MTNNRTLVLVDIYFPLQDNKPELDDLLHLNEYFRFTGMPYDDHGKKFRRDFGEIPVSYQTGENPQKIKELGQLECYFERWANLLEINVKKGEQFYRLFPVNWGRNSRKLSYNQGKPQYENNWQIYDDNRTYVWTAAFLEEGGVTLQKKFNFEELWYGNKEKMKASEYGHWWRLLNVDPPDFNSEYKSHQLTQFDRDWLDRHTYKRWEQTGSWYGFTSHSGAVLATAEFTFAPWSSYYCDTSMLLFYIRLSLFRFSSELTKTFREKTGRSLKDHFRRIRKEFSKFTVYYQFPQLSNQQQHVEMYKLNRKYFEIENFFAEIKEEIDNNHDFLESIDANELTKSANRLAKYGIPLAAGGLVAGIFGINSFHIYECLWENCNFEFDLALETGLIVFVSVIVFFVIWLKSGGDK